MAETGAFGASGSRLLVVGRPEAVFTGFRFAS